MSDVTIKAPPMATYVNQVKSGRVHIIQDCPGENCTMKVESLLRPGDVIPEPRLCVSCKGEK